MTKTFLQFLVEDEAQRDAQYKSHIKKIALANDLKVTDSNRGRYHIRFSMPGTLKDFNKFFKKYGAVVEESDAQVSGSFPTYMIRQETPYKDIDPGQMILWVNNSTGKGSKVEKIFNTKELTPDALGLAGRTMKAREIITEVTKILEDKYPSKQIHEPLIRLLNRSYERGDRISFKDDMPFGRSDLSTVSKDFGEILSALWTIKNLRFPEVYFPAASNEPLVDFYGVRFGIEYPFSVKSGSGSKVSVQNIINAIKKRAKSSSRDINEEVALKVFKIVNENSTKEQMIELNKLMETKAIKTLGKIIGVDWRRLDIREIDSYLKDKTMSELRVELKPFFKAAKSPVKSTTWKQPDKFWPVIAPLGGVIVRVLNESKEIKKSLTNVARQVTLVQVNVDVKTKTLIFKNNRFRDASFEFGWAGYKAGNKLGFKMKLRS